MCDEKNFKTKEEILKKIDSINQDIKSLTESSRSEYVNEGIINQVRIRVEELENEKDNLEKMLEK